MKAKQIIILCVCFISFSFTKGSHSVELSASSQENEEYDVKLSNFLQEILENFREQMPEGIPDIGVPAVDPLIICDIDEDINERLAHVVLRMRHLNITGISKFQIELLKADLEKGFANVSITVPELTAHGDCYMNGKILNIFPIRSDGPFYIQASEVHMKGYADLNVTTGDGQTRLHMNDLQLHLTFRSLKMEFESLLGGGKLTEVLVKILSGLGPRLFLHFHEQIMEILNKALLQLINKELDKGTLSELLDQIQL